MATLGALNFIAQWNSHPVTDGVKWIFFRGVVVADSVSSGSAGEQAGIQKGDQISAINFQKIRIPQDVGAIAAKEMAAKKPLQYDIARGNETFVALVNPKPRANSFYFYLASVGFVILAIGLFAFLKGHSRSFALHFYFLCLAFFGAYVFSFTGKLNLVDWVFFWADEIFLLLLPPLFLHFAFYFPGQRQWIPKDRLFFLYLPSIAFISARILFTLFYFLNPSSPYITSIEGYLAFENFEIFYLFLGLISGIVVLFYSYAKSEDIIQRKQLKLVLAGLVAGFAPFCILWLFSLVVRVPNQALEAALMPQILIPLSLTYALFKYRLMDVDIIIKRGMIYTLTTMVLFVMYLMLTVSTVKFLMPDATRFTTVAIASLTTLLAALLFQPLRDRVRSFVDRVYYKDSYDYRRTLIQFSREITSSLDIEQLSSSLIKHVVSTFKIERADLLVKTGLNRFESSLNPDVAINPGLGFLTVLSTDPFVFVDSYFNIDAELLEDEKVLRKLNLNYFIPCRFKHNIVAIVAVSKKEKGDYLSSEDLDLLVTLANQLAIVIENHRLFYTLKNKADELERLKNFNENILLSLNVGICTLDENGKVVACNQSMESFLGMNRVSILGQRLEEIFPTEIVDRYKNYNLKSARKKLEGTRFYKTMAENFKGQDSVMNLSFVPLINESDVEYGTILILDDVTHQAKLEEQLTQSEKLSALGLLAAGVAHEVNTPLTGISSYTQMLEHQIAHPETKEILQKIEQQTFRASKIINTLLDLSREQPVAVENIDVNELLRETLVLLQPHFKDSPVEVVQEFDPSNPAISGNEGKLQQVFTNLFLNARDAMNGGGRLLVRTETEDGQVVINIVDTGIGMDEKTLKRIYEPFFSKKSFKGTGLGLAITYTIIQEHKGSIDVFSEEGKGTHFQIKLPMKREVHEQSRAYSGD
jgi:PAS domain S-box-containing protein